VITLSSFALSEQDEDATELNEAELVESVALVADNETAEVAKALAKRRSIFQRRWYRRSGRPSYVLGFFRFRRCGAIISTPSFASCSSNGSAS
jgi:hypothetical protein